MGYLHIENLYTPDGQKILAFKECYALEKIDGTSARVFWKENKLGLSPGGSESREFESIFDREILSQKFYDGFEDKSVFVYGEAYGGKIQGLSKRYGNVLKFVAFDVQIDGMWLAVPQAEKVASLLGLDFVSYAKIPTEEHAMNAERDRPSDRSKKNGIQGDWPREGVVLRPVFEVATNNGKRVIAKHKRDSERETLTPRKVDQGTLAAISKADDLVLEYVTPKRFEHVMDHVMSLTGKQSLSKEDCRLIVSAMVEDVFREGDHEIKMMENEKRIAAKKIGLKTSQMFFNRINKASG